MVVAFSIATWVEYVLSTVKTSSPHSSTDRVQASGAWDPRSIRGRGITRLQILPKTAGNSTAKIHKKKSLRAKNYAEDSKIQKNKFLKL